MMDKWGGHPVCVDCYRHLIIDRNELVIFQFATFRNMTVIAICFMCRLCRSNWPLITVFISLFSALWRNITVHSQRKWIDYGPPSSQPMLTEMTLKNHHLYVRFSNNYQSRINLLTWNEFANLAHGYGCISLEKWMQSITKMLVTINPDSTGPIPFKSIGDYWLITYSILTITSGWRGGRGGGSWCYTAASLTLK